MQSKGGRRSDSEGSLDRDPNSSTLQHLDYLPSWACPCNCLLSDLLVTWATPLDHVNDFAPKPPGACPGHAHSLDPGVLHLPRSPVLQYRVSTSRGTGRCRTVACRWSCGPRCRNHRDEGEDTYRAKKGLGGKKWN